MPIARGGLVTYAVKNRHNHAYNMAPGMVSQPEEVVKGVPNQDVDCFVR